MYNLLTPNIASYELLDSGNYEKLERFGEYILARPEPQAVWDKSLSDEIWQKKASAIFKKTKGRDQLSPEERGEWHNIKKMPEKWLMNYEQGKTKLKFKLSLSSFKHVGIFPEQAANWRYIEEKISLMKDGKNALQQAPKVLNLFAYTGGASLVAKANGADITHVDSVKQVISWSRENMEASNLTDIRWVIEDALKFVKREVKRGKKYNGIILDPPAYGRGPDGEKWVLEEGLNELLKNCLELLDENHHFFILNLYSMGFSAVIAETIIRQNKTDIQNPEMGELVLEDSFQKKLPLGVFYRFSTV
ncbi:Ribosomal RNA large subunit methyltransferase K/L [Emticicia aquatica]|uniref:Ribosomal RNA large subunit methyltransferase K/L n=1 Tax=Emticicia aquatica TaxID=1681835 RepID=A0ABN8EQD3_9BACT|nr:class I SAM-dependent methyltransferase [Emticicia aquatica]CAH0995114.1 Ribosomal RNA large subunit methyltransferase K/L [Emticicia aquatica]